MVRKTIQFKMLLTPEQLILLKTILESSQEDSEEHRRLFNKFLYGGILSLNADELATLRTSFKEDAVLS